MKDIYEYQCIKLKYLIINHCMQLETLCDSFSVSYLDLMQPTTQYTIEMFYQIDCYNHVNY